MVYLCSSTVAGPAAQPCSVSAGIMAGLLKQGNGKVYTELMLKVKPCDNHLTVNNEHMCISINLLWLLESVLSLDHPNVLSKL